VSRNDALRKLDSSQEKASRGRGAQAIPIVSRMSKRGRGAGPKLVSGVSKKWAPLAARNYDNDGARVWDPWQPKYLSTREKVWAKAIPKCRDKIKT